MYSCFLVDSCKQYLSICTMADHIDRSIFEEIKRAAHVTFILNERTMASSAADQLWNNGITLSHKPVQTLWHQRGAINSSVSSTLCKKANRPIRDSSILSRRGSVCCGPGYHYFNKEQFPGPMRESDNPCFPEKWDKVTNRFLSLHFTYKQSHENNSYML